MQAVVRHESGERAHLAVLQGNDAHKIGVILLQLRQLPGEATLFLSQAAAPWQVLLLDVAAESGFEGLAMSELVPAAPGTMQYRSHARHAFVRAAIYPSRIMLVADFVVHKGTYELCQNTMTACSPRRMQYSVSGWKHPATHSPHSRCARARQAYMLACWQNQGSSLTELTSLRPFPSSRPAHRRAQTPPALLHRFHVQLLPFPAHCCAPGRRRRILHRHRPPITAEKRE